MGRAKTEYRCEGCGGAVPTKRKYCDACTAWKKKEKDGWRRVPTRHGVVEKQLTVASAYGSYVFSPSFPGYHDTSCTLASLIAGLIKLAIDGTEYLPVAHRHWLAVLLNEMLSAPKIKLGWRPEREVGFDDGKGTDLSRLLKHWVPLSFAEGRTCPVLPHFALAAAHFVAAHYWGAYFDGKWKIAPRVGPELGEDDQAMFDDGTDRREFTQCVGTVFVRAVVPPGAKVVLHRSKKPTEYGSGHQFEFAIHRCYTSSGIQDRSGLEFFSPPRAYDVFERFCGYGNLIEKEEPAGLYGEVPFEWITEQHIRAAEGEEEGHFEPLPEWLRPRPALTAGNVVTLDPGRTPQ